MRTYVFKTEGNDVFHARIEVWSDNGCSLYSKVFTTNKDRKRWIKDKLYLLSICPPVHPEPDPEFEEYLMAA